MRGFIHGTTLLLREKGIRGIFRALVPTTAKQTANSAIRFGSYSILRQIAEDRSAPGTKLGAMTTFGIGGIAGLVTVLVTQPLDTIKTRMQSLDAAQYRNSVTCGVQIVTDQGLLTLWSGCMPRLARLVVSSSWFKFT